MKEVGSELLTYILKIWYLLLVCNTNSKCTKLDKKHTGALYLLDTDSSIKLNFQFLNCNIAFDCNIYVFVLESIH